MIIRTPLSELDETLYKYNALLGWAEDRIIMLDEKTMLVVKDYRIRIPELMLTLRYGYLMSQSRNSLGCNESILSDDGSYKVDENWQVDLSLTVIYDINDEEVSKFQGYCEYGFQAAVADFLYPKCRELSELDDIECLIDTSDFLDEENAAYYAQECEEEYAEEYGD